jgi:hypothetical protein
MSQSAYEEETLAYKARVEADGGMVNNIASLNSDIKMLKSTGDWGKYNMILLPCGGMKLRESEGINYVEKWYCVKGNDAVQDVISRQPVYGDEINGIPIVTANGSSNAMIFNMIDVKSAIAVTSGNPGITSTHFLSGYDGANLMFVSMNNLQYNWRNTGQTSLYNVIEKSLRIDSHVTDGMNGNVWRNGTQSTEQEKNELSLNVIFARYTQTASYWMGKLGALILSNQVINREVIEYYYITKCNIT